MQNGAKCQVPEGLGLSKRFFPGQTVPKASSMASPVWGPVPPGAPEPAGDRHRKTQAEHEPGHCEPPRRRGPQRQHPLPREATTTNISISSRANGGSGRLTHLSGWLRKRKGSTMPSRGSGGAFLEQSSLETRGSEAENSVAGRARRGEVFPPLSFAPAGSQIPFSSSSQLCPLTAQPSRGRTRTVTVTVRQEHCPAQSRGSINTCGINTCSLKGLLRSPRRPKPTYSLLGLHCPAAPTHPPTTLGSRGS